MEKLLRLESGEVVNLTMVTSIRRVIGQGDKYLINLVGGLSIEINEREISKENFIKRWDRAISNSSNDELLLG